MGGMQAGGGQNRQLTQQQRDSSMLVQRKTSLASVKEIKISGFKDITDTLVSIYNEYGLKAVANFDQHGAFVYELAIPLNLLGLSATEGKDFAYQIKINGMTMNFGGNNGGGGIAVTGSGSGGGNFGGNGGRGNGGAGGGFIAASTNNFQDLATPTDFWGKYTLLKK
jgi:hypothetical protein